MPAVGADLGVVFDRAGERLYLIDEQAHECPLEQALLLFLRLIGSNGRRGKLAFPVTVTSQVEQMVEGTAARGRPHAGLARRPDARRRPRTASSSPARSGGGYVFPEFLPAYDAVASLGKLLELLAPVKRAALGARRRAARPHARPPRAAVPVGAEGRRHARPQRAPGATGGSTSSTGSRSSTSAAGRRCCPTPTSRSSTSTPRARREETRRSSRRELRALVDEIVQGDEAADGSGKPQG